MQMNWKKNPRMIQNKNAQRIRSNNKLRRKTSLDESQEHRMLKE